MWKSRKKVSDSQSLDKVLAEAVAERQAYYPRLLEGKGQGFHLILFLDPTVDGVSQLLLDTLEEFKKSTLYRSPQDFPRLHNHGSNPQLRSGLTLLIGHPIPQPMDAQVELVKEHVRGWFAAVDKVSGGSMKAVASVAFGEIIYQRPQEGEWNAGRLIGETYFYACMVVCDAIYIFNSWESHGQHRIAANSQAIGLLNLPASIEQHRAYEDQRLVMYGFDWTEEMLR